MLLDSLRTTGRPPAVDPHRLLQLMIALQAQHQWLSPETLAGLARDTELPLHRVRATASFYSFLNTQTPIDYRVLFSDNITDRMLGSEAMLRRLCHTLWVEPGKVSEDGLVRVGTTSCTGLCDQGPAVLVNGRAIPSIDEIRIDAMAGLIRDRIPVEQWPSHWFEISCNIRRADRLLSPVVNPGSILHALAQRSPDDLISAIEASGLRGRGGAGYPTGAKWKACRAASGNAVVVCNADEGEPGTFKDRVLLASVAERVIDGMCVAARAVGARHGFIYLRGEYEFLAQSLRQMLKHRRLNGLLGDRLPWLDHGFDIELHLGAGAYVCGEESALIESLEGKPGKPRIRPPFPVTNGYLGRPTIVNNVETFACVALIAEHGPAWFRKVGTTQSSGTKLLSVSGDVQSPGVYEVPFGIRLLDVLRDCGAIRPKAVTIAGAAGACLSADEFDRRIGFEDLSTGGSIMVFSEQRDVFEIARNFAKFFAHESCGFCTPCRVGTEVVDHLLTKIDRGRGSAYDLDEIQRLHRVMQGASHCGLGNTATLALADLIQKFRPSFEARFRSNHYEPAFDLDAALSRARSMTGRDDVAAHLKSNAESGSDAISVAPAI